MESMTLTQLQQASATVYRYMSPTPQYCWPQLCEQVGTEVWLKHENHTPAGAFKVRGGMTYMQWLREARPEVSGIITATRGNHGQSQARAAAEAGISAKIVVPFGNSQEKNTAMRTFGAELVEHGRDFDEAKAEAMRLASAEDRLLVPAFHEQLVMGVASYALELFNAVRDIDQVYVPVGCGSGICALIAARDALGLSTEIIGVVSTEADGVKQSFDAGRLIETKTAATFADGMAVRAPIPEAFEIYASGAARIVAVTDEEVAEAMRVLFAATHNVAEGAGAAAFAAITKNRHHLKGKRVAAILTGANVDTEILAQVLSGSTPKV